jgi:hypothetical protein
MKQNVIAPVDVTLERAYTTIQRYNQETRIKHPKLTSSSHLPVLDTTGTASS